MFVRSQNMMPFMPEIKHNGIAISNELNKGNAIKEQCTYNILTKYCQVVEHTFKAGRRDLFQDQVLVHLKLTPWLERGRG